VLFALRSPFNSRLKWMKTIHAPPRKAEDQRRMAVVKGAAERILGCCTHYLHKGGWPLPTQYRPAEQEP
jgi:magnesium-transporting ATPase (P-type)